MIPALFKKVFGSRNDRLLRQYGHTVRAINALESGIAGLSDAELRAKTDAFKERYRSGEPLDKLLEKSSQPGSDGTTGIIATPGVRGTEPTETITVDPRTRGDR